MLITFHSKAAADIMMYKDHAKLILDLLHKDSDQGIITAAEAPRAIEIIEKEIEESKRHPMSELVKRDVEAHHGEEGDDAEHEDAQIVTFAMRAYPLLDMLREAKKGGFDVVWGV